MVYNEHSPTREVHTCKYLHLKKKKNPRDKDCKAHLTIRALAALSEDPGLVPRTHVGSLGTGVVASHETPHGFWELNFGPLEKQLML